MWKPLVLVMGSSGDLKCGNLRSIAIIMGKLDFTVDTEEGGIPWNPDIFKLYIIG